MTETARLLSALAEREVRLREARKVARHADAMSHAVELIYGSDDLEQGIRDVLQLCQKVSGADLWGLLRRADGVVTTLATSESEASNQSWPDADDKLSRIRQVSDLSEVPWFDDLPQVLRAYRSQVSVPVAVPSEPPMAIMILSRQRAAFSRFDRKLMQGIGRLLEQVIDKQRLAHRNATLARVVDSSPKALPTEMSFLDSSFEALSHAYSRMVDWQGQVVDITNELLSAPLNEAHTAIENALARTGRLANSDRTYVFRMRLPDRLDNTHEWVAPGIAPMISELQDMPDSLLDDWRTDFNAGRAVHISDVEALPESSGVKEILRMQGIQSLLAVPMLRDGCITGFKGFDAVRSHRQFLPFEITLLQSVSNAVSVVLERVAAKAAADSARASLRVERDRLKTTLAAIPDLVLELDQEGRFVGNGAETLMRLNVLAEAPVGHTPEEALEADAALMVRSVMDMVDRNEQNDTHEHEITVNGVPRTFEVSGAVRRQDGQPVGYVFVCHDVTERIRERIQLKRLGKIAELTSNLVVITDKDQRIEWVNPAFERRSGWKLDEIRGVRPDSFLATDQTDRTEMRRIGAALRAGRPVRGELLNRSRQGEDYWISKDIQPLFGSGGQVSGFVAVQTDVTTLKQSYERTLRDYSATLDGSNDGIAMTDAAGHYIYMNPMHHRMFGIPETEDVRRLHWHDLYSPEAVERFMAQVWPQLEKSGHWRGKLQGRHRDGGPVIQEVSLASREEGLLCITRDVSERERLEVEHSRLREELQLAQRRETVAQLASEVGHDLNNLLAVVDGSVSLLDRYVEDNDEAQAGVNRILRATDAAKHLVTRLDNLGYQQRMPEWNDLRVLIEEGVELLGMARIKEHAVSIEKPDYPCPIWADHTDLLQVIVNLALNACDATGDGHNRVGLTVIPDGRLPKRPPDAGVLCLDAELVMFTVSDTGKGISASRLPNIFKRHFSTKKMQGTGLGLPIVARILHENNAALWVDSTLGNGTTVTVAWPSKSPNVDDREPPEMIQSAQASLVGCNILVVDDLQDVAEVFSEMLEAVGAICVSLSDPYEAQELLRDNPGVWSVLVTDYNMPEMLGGNLARTAAACSPPVPAILMTAVSETIGSDAQLFHAVLSKPIDSDQLIDAVRSVL